MKRRNFLVAALFAPFAAAFAAVKNTEIPTGGIVPDRGCLVGECVPETLLPPSIVRKIEAASAPKRQLLRVIYHPGVLSDDARDRLRASVEEAINSGKVLVLEEGMTYQEFYGEPGPVKIELRQNYVSNSGTSRAVREFLANQGGIQQLKAKG